MKIISLEANNIKRLTAVSITPEGNVIQITGKNGEGKSSVIDSIWMALGGANAIPKEPIHKGAKKGSIEINLGKYIVKRSFTENGSYLSVETEDGAKYGSPQKMLDDLIGRFSFDPLAFMRMAAKDQFDALALHLNIDLEEVDGEYWDIYNRRKDVNRDLSAKTAELQSIPVIEDAPEEEIDIDNLINEINDAREKNGHIEHLKGKLGRANESAGLYLEEIRNIEAELVKMKEHYEEMVIDVGKLQDEYQVKEKETVDIAEMEHKLRNSQRINEGVKSNKRRLELKTAGDEILKQSETLTAQLKANRERRMKMITEAGMPVEGLSFGDGVILYNGLPLDQASGADKIRITTAIAMAMNQQLRVIRIEDGSLLDSTSMKIIEDLAADNDYQFWIERVDETGKVGILIEDGQVAAINGKKVEKQEVAEPESNENDRNSEEFDFDNSVMTKPGENVVEKVAKKARKPEKIGPSEF